MSNAERRTITGQGRRQSKQIPRDGERFVSTLGFSYAYRQIKLKNKTKQQCNCILTGGKLQK